MSTENRLLVLVLLLLVAGCGPDKSGENKALVRSSAQSSTPSIQTVVSTSPADTVFSLFGKKGSGTFEDGTDFTVRFENGGSGHLQVGDQNLQVSVLAQSDGVSAIKGWVRGRLDGVQWQGTLVRFGDGEGRITINSSGGEVIKRGTWTLLP